MSWFVKQAIQSAAGDVKKLCELLVHISELPVTVQDEFLIAVTSPEIAGLPELERLQVWERMDAFVRRHRRFHEAKWALREEQISKFEAAANLLIPSDPSLVHRRLFGEIESDLYSENSNYEKQRAELRTERGKALKEIFDIGGLGEVISFGNQVPKPAEVGSALASFADHETEQIMLREHLLTAEEQVGYLTAGYINSKFWEKGKDWVTKCLDGEWAPDLIAAFLRALPFKEDVWNFVTQYLGDNREQLYWDTVWVNPFGPEEDLSLAIEKLIQFNRPAEAVNCAARAAERDTNFSVDLSIKALLAFLESGQDAKALDNYSTIELIKQIQSSDEVDDEALFKIEWSFLPWLDRFSTGSPKFLERRLSTESAFFVELIRLVYRSKKPEENQPDEKIDTQHRQNLARNAYRLLSEWKRCPGLLDDDSFSADEFNAWIKDVIRLTKDSGHLEVAQIQIGHVLTCAPGDPSGLWIHESVANVLNQKGSSDMREGFTTQLYNDRGVHGYTKGEEERRLAEQHRQKAEDLELGGFIRFATSIREFAEQYARDAKREEKGGRFGDL